MKTINFYTVKGGQGATVTAAMMAMILSEKGDTAVVGEDIPTVLGMDLEPDEAGKANDHLQVAPYSRDGIVDIMGFEYLVSDDWIGHYDGLNVLVTKACYLALRKATQAENRPDAVVLVEEPGRSFDVRDVENVVGVPVVATIPYTPATSRLVDAGLLATRLPEDARDELQSLVDMVDKDLHHVHKCV